jgi:transposase-like protein
VDTCAVACETRQVLPYKVKKWARRTYTDEFKGGAVQQVVGECRTVKEVAKALALTRSAPDIWGTLALADASNGAPGALTISKKEVWRGCAPRTVA